MGRFSKSLALGTIVLAVAVFSLKSDAQDRGRRGGFDPEQMQARMMERMQEVMGSSDEEWKVLQPLVTDVMEIQREARSGGGFGFMMMGRGGPGGPGGPDGDDDRGRRGRRGFGPEPSPEVQALQESLRNEDTSASEIQEKLKAVREARKKEQVALEKAQDKLRKVLSVRQEALLVMMGMLE